MSEILHTLEEETISYLNLYLFQHVWNNPVQEFRRNVVPALMCPRPTVGMVTSRTDRVILPVPETQYVVYMIPRQVLGVEPNMVAWTSLTTLLNEQGIDLRVTGTHGQWLSHDRCFLKNNQSGDGLWLAVEAAMFWKVMGTPYAPKDVYVSVYYDSDVANTITVANYNPAAAGDLTSLRTLCSGLDLTVATVFVNGKYIPGRINVGDTTMLALGDYVEIITDNNVIGQFDLDLTVNSDNRFYASTSKDLDCNIVHIPKALNPTNKVITHNTCDVFVWPRNLTVKRGLFVHRCQQSKSFVQLTHNDFAIPTYILDSYREQLGQEELVLRVKIRVHGNDNVLMRDARYIDLLYALDDNKIAAFLEGAGPAQLSCWNAVELDTNPYTRAMGGMPTNSALETMDYYFSVFGYFQALSLICSKLRKYTVAEGLERTFVIPSNIFANYINAVVYRNGLKLREDQVTTAWLDADADLQLTIAEEVDWVVGDELIVELLHDPLGQEPVEQLVTVGSPALAVVTDTEDDFLIYERKDLATPVRGVGGAGFTHSYQLMVKSDVVESETSVETEEEGGFLRTSFTTTLTFKAAALGKTYLVVPNRYLFCFDVDLDTLMVANDELVVTLVRDGDVPVIGDCKHLVFLNGKYLVPGVDYNPIVLEDIDHNQVRQQISVQNSSYLLPSGNRLEILVVPDPVVDRQYGFTLNGKTNQGGQVPLWVPGLSLLSLDGLTTMDVDYVNGRMVPTDIFRERALWATRTLAPGWVVDSSVGTSIDEDTARFKAIQTYLQTLGTDESDVVVMPYSHHLYSTYLNAIYRDVINGTKVLTFEPSNPNIQTQVSEYEYLKAFDLCLHNLHDLNFVDYYPAYRQLVVEDIDMYNNLARLKAVTLPADAVEDNEAEA